MIRRLVLTGLVALTLSGCAVKKHAGLLEGTSWKLSTLFGVGLGLRPQDAPTMSIKDSMAAGFGGCNGYSVALTVFGTVTTFGAVTRAERVCPMAGTKLENEFFRALAGTARAEVKPDQLILRDQSGVERARFIRAR